MAKDEEEEPQLVSVYRGHNLLSRRSTIRGQIDEKGEGDGVPRGGTSSRWFVCSQVWQNHFRRGTLRSICSVEGVLQ